MGCISSKAAAACSPLRGTLEEGGEYKGGGGGDNGGGSRETIVASSVDSRKVVGPSTQNFRLQENIVIRCIEGEQVAAGWPAWLSSVAKEAIQGWVPLKAEAYEKLEKIGQGTYSTVYKARELETGRIVALKKVRFDNYEPESVRFMSREILILRKLNHPNIVKLEGIVTARLSTSIYLVFEYMEHDLAGLSSSRNIKFSASQVKCYMQQLLSALDHCHSNGIMHRDIKCSNLLVNNEGILKMADFGLANFYRPADNQPLTSRVVTLWYRPPELLLGSNNYEPTVDLWSVGCVFGELFVGKPVLQGRTEVEQIHKIFKLCGSPQEEYWANTKLRHSTAFKPHQQYVNCLRETFNFLPDNAFTLLEAFLSIEPHKRGAAKSALESEYFKSKPYACDPSSLPKYSPHKELDARSREEAHRRRVGRRRPAAQRRPSRTQTSTGMPNGDARPEAPRTKTYSIDSIATKKDSSGENGEGRLLVELRPDAASTLPSKDKYRKHNSEVYPYSGPLSSANASGLMWARKPTENDSSNRSATKSGSRNNANIARVSRPKKTEGREDSENKPMLKNVLQFHDARNDMLVFPQQDASKDYRRPLDHQNHTERLGFSGQLVSDLSNDHELLAKHERHMRQAVRRSWFQRG